MIGRWIDTVLYLAGDWHWLAWLCKRQAWALRLLTWAIEARAEWRTCPNCSGDALQILAPRNRYFGKCPKCNEIWC